MANIDLKMILQLRNDTEENWILNKSVIPKKGEACVSTFADKAPKMKIGDGITTWENLKYLNVTPQELQESISSIVNTTYDLEAAAGGTGEANINLKGSDSTTDSVTLKGGGKTSVSVSGNVITITSLDDNTQYEMSISTSTGEVKFGPVGSSTTIATLGTAAFKATTDFDAAGAASAVLGTAEDPSTANTVYGAKKAATEANNAASVAQSTADGAVEAAGTAQTTAEGAASAAATAQSAAEAAQATANAAIPATEKGANNGVATLDGTGKIPAAQLPASVDEIIEAENYDALPEDGEESKIYITLDNNKTYRWGGSAYVEISASIALGETTGTAFDGAKGAQLRTDLDAHTSNSEIHVTASDKTNWNGKTTMADVEAKGYQTAAQVKAIKVDNATHAEAADNATNLGGQPASYYAPVSSIPTVPIQSVVGNNGVTASLAGTTVTVGLNLTDVFILNGGNAAGTWE